MSQCFKCRQGIGTIVSRDGPRTLYCTNCFLIYCSNLVRDNLFQQCFLACDTPVAVAVSGGPNSMLLLRELGQLRRKTQEQHRQRALISPSPPSAVSPIGSTFELLPFHLCEAELILPPAMAPLSSSSPAPTPATDSATESTQQQQLSSSATAAAAYRARQAAVEQVRSSMQKQFDKLQKLVQQQPPLWAYHDESLDGKKNKKKRSKASEINFATEVAASAGMGTSDANEEECSLPTYLFDKSEVRVFQYSDFLPAVYIDQVRHALHTSKLSLTDREALYSRVKQQVLCRAAQRVTDEFREKQRLPDVEESACVSAVGRTEEGQIGDFANGLANRPSTSALVSSWYHLLTGDNAARCAIAALESIVTGAGGDGIVHGSAFRGLLHNVVCLRPIRTMLPKEAVLCCRLHGITCSYTPALSTGTSLRSMHQVLEQFVYTMILSFRTMVFNVLNTVQKLRVHPESMQELVQFVGLVGDGRQAKGGEGQQSNSMSYEQKKNAGSGNNKRALPGRTAQQNQRDLRASHPPVVYRSSTAMTRVTDPSAADANRQNNKLIDQAVVQCCMCGCPTSAPFHDRNEEAAVLGIDLFAVTDAHRGTAGVYETPASRSAGPSPLPSSTMDCFVCHACRSLFKAWSSSTLAQEGCDNASQGAPADALRADRPLF